MNVINQNMLDRLEKHEGTSLVLSGGATKAFYFHLGVLKALHLEHMENVSSIVGTSAGAVLGALVAGGISVESLSKAVFQDKIYLPEVKKWLRSLTASMLFTPDFLKILQQSAITGVAGIRFLAGLPLIARKDLMAEALDSLINSQSHISSFFSTQALTDLIKSLVDAREFKDLNLDLYVTATDLDSGRRAVFNSRYAGIDSNNRFFNDVPLDLAVRASTSVPGLFEPVKINGRYYIDGEVKRTLSADIGMHLADTVIISHTYQPLERSGNRTIKDMGWWNIVKQSLYIVFHERIRVWEELYKERYPNKQIISIAPRPDDEFFFRAPIFTFRPEIQKALMHSGEIAARYALDEFENRHLPLSV